MPPVLHLVRHAQGYHNVSENGHTIRDPELTTEGQKQCHALRDSFPYPKNIDLLLSNPMARTPQTTLRAFSPCLEQCLPIIARPNAQDATIETSDTKRWAAELREVFNGDGDGERVDLSRVDDD